MTTSVEAIAELYTRRKAAAGLVAGRMRELRDTYNGDVVIPLPERETRELPAVANLTAQGLDQIATRVASVMPDVVFPTGRAGKAEQGRSIDRRRAVLGWWDRNLMHLMLRRRARHLEGYGIAPVLIRPDFKTGTPRWEQRDPLATFPGQTATIDDPVVPDCIFAVTRSMRWLLRNYRDQMGALAKGNAGDDPDALFEVVEYVDHDEIVTLVMGRTDKDPFSATVSGSMVQQLERLPNRAECCTAVVPGRINLDRQRGRFDGMIGMHQMQARLFALEVIAVEQGIFPDEWLISRDGQTPEIVQVADGRSGRVGMVKGGELRNQQLQPGYQTLPTIDRLERNQRLTAGIPAEFGGESATNIRTGRRGENVLSATIDFSIKESQEILAASLEAENRAAIAVDRGYHNVPKSFYVSWYGAKGHLDYTPKELFTTDEHYVSYAHAGADANSLSIAGLQRVGAGTMSKQGFMQIDPMVEDVELEGDRIVAEALEQALLQGIQAQAAQGAIPPGDVARIVALVRDDDKDLATAVATAQREAQERQAKQVEAQSAEAQPGLAQPGAGAEATAAIPESAPSLRGLLSDLRMPQMGVAAERPRPEAMV